MNKKLKIATVAVSAVMAGTMAFGMFGCSNSGGGLKIVDPNVDESGKLTWAAGTTVNTAIGYQNSTEGIAYHTDNNNIVGKSGATLMGKTYSSGDLKPGWKKLADDLNITLTDKWSHAKASGQASANLGTVKDGPGGFSAVDVFTTNTSVAHASTDKLLNLADYLDYMPNYKKFLESSDVVGMSLLASGDGDMYVAPYFDGNNDIEKYVLLRKDIVEAMLDKDLPTTGDGTFARQGGKFDTTTGSGDSATTTQHNLESTSVTAYMGHTNYTVKTTKPSSIDQAANGRYGTDKIKLKNNNTDTDTVDVTVNYTAALGAAQTSGSALNTALTTAKSTLDVSALDSGNIIDLMNAVLENNMDVSGTKLINILRAYIDVAYTVDNQPLYTEANNLKRSGVFNSACAAWDVDLYAALGRCYVSSGSMFVTSKTTTDKEGKETKTYFTAQADKPMYLVSGRSNTNQRQTDLYSLVGELYGVRGLESRYSYMYVDHEGKLQDARQNEATWDAMDAFSKLTAEGLVNFNLAGGDYGAHRSNYETLSLHDYAQTQTKGDGFNPLADNEVYNMAPVVTPVSKWDTDDNGIKDTIMRFTESWRSVKTEGIAVSKNVATNADKLSAVLAFIDYIYSPDGQIVMTYGPQSTNGNTNPNGLWYATEADSSVTLATVADAYTPATNYLGAQYKIKDAYKSQYFIYNGKIYTGTLYGTRRIPTLTDENLEYFADGHNFTNHARRNLGTCLPVGNKDQGFEYQCTADCGLDGSDIVAMCLANGTIDHPTQTVNKSDYWHLLVPTALPYNSMETDSLKQGNIAHISGVGSTQEELYGKSSDNNPNFFLTMLKTGYSTTAYSGANATVNRTDAAAIVASHESMNIATFETRANTAFARLIAWLDAKNAPQA
ncbi:MAG: hypothetical protein NC033_00130 [Clostridiales bacterium]|nr:hypothetical protein [Clostridiales bacterium]